MRAAVAVPSTTAHRDLASAATLLAKTYGDRRAALDLARSEAYGGRVVGYLKGAVEAGTSSNWAASLSENDALVGAFAASLRQRSAFGAVLAAGAVSLPFSTRCTVEAAGASAFLSGQGAAIPIAKLAPEAVFLTRERAGAIIIISKELAQSPEAEAIVEIELRRAVSQVLDEALFTAIISSTTSLNIASAGSSEANMRTDLAALLDAMDPDADSKLLWAAAPDVATKIRLLEHVAVNSTDGSMRLVGFPVVTSNVMSAGDLHLIDASRIAARLEAIEIDVSDETSVEMSDGPTNNSSSPTGTSVVSLWQTNSIGVLVRAFYGIERLRGNAAATVSGIGWSF